MNKMTLKEYHEAVKVLAAENKNKELEEKAIAELLKLEKQQRKRAEKQETSERAKVNEQLGEIILETMMTSTEPMKVSDIQTLLNEMSYHYSTQRISAILSKLVDNQQVIREYPTQRNKPAVYFLPKSE